MTPDTYFDDLFWHLLINVIADDPIERETLHSWRLDCKTNESMRTAIRAVLSANPKPPLSIGTVVSWLPCCSGPRLQDGAALHYAGCQSCCPKPLTQEPT